MLLKLMLTLCEDLSGLLDVVPSNWNELLRDALMSCWT